MKAHARVSIVKLVNGAESVERQFPWEPQEAAEARAEHWSLQLEDDEERFVLLEEKEGAAESCLLN